MQAIICKYRISKLYNYHIAVGYDGDEYRGYGYSIRIILWNMRDNGGNYHDTPVT